MAGSNSSRQARGQRNLLPNSSFESGRDGPDGWRFSGPTEHASGSWDRVEAHSGERCLAFFPPMQESAWESDPVPIVGGRRYGLTWWTRFEGSEPWHWSYHSQFVGAMARLLGSDGQEIGRVERKLHCLQTAGWQQAWIKLEAPARAQRATVAFVYRTGIETNGRVWIDDVELESLAQLPPPAEGHARILLRVTDAAGDPLAARMWVKAGDGTHLFPKYAYRFSVPDIGFHAAPEDCSLEVPAGEVTVGARRGFEYAPAQQSLRLEAGERREVRLALDRPIDMPSEGFFCGDHHSHLFFHKHTQHPQMRPAESFEIAKAEGLNYLSLDGEMIEFRAHLEDHEKAREEQFVGEMGLEAVTDFYGHLCLIGVREDMPGGFPMRTVFWPPNELVQEYVTRQGGAVVSAHPLNDIPLENFFAAVADPVRGCMARELAVDVLLGRRVSYDVYSHCEPPLPVTDLLAAYYHLLNLGRRIGITASTDYYVDQGRGACGQWRTYARCPQLDFASIAEAYREGRTFATNAPLISLQVGGAEPGDELDLAAPGEIGISVRAASQWGLESAEIVVNGEPRQRWSATDGQLDVSARVRVDETSWVAARVLGPASPEVDSSSMASERGAFTGQFAHTSPVYVRVGNADFRPRRAAVEFCVAWAEAMEKAVVTWRDSYLAADLSAYGLTGVEAQERVLSRIAEAKAIAARLLKTAV